MNPAPFAPFAPFGEQSTGHRVRVEGDLYHGRIPDGAVYVGRAAPGIKRSPFANPYPWRRYGLDESLRLYVDHLIEHPALVALAREQLAGRVLACWCKLDQPCHADILFAIANGSEWVNPSPGARAYPSAHSAPHIQGDPRE